MQPLGQPILAVMMGMKIWTLYFIVNQSQGALSLNLVSFMISVITHWSYTHWPEYLVGWVLTRMTINNKITRDIKNNVDITFQDFVSCICANMGINPATDKIGWKSSDDLKCAPAQQLDNESDLKNAFCDLLKMQSSTQRTKEVIMFISHIISPFQNSDMLNDFSVTFCDFLRILSLLRHQRRRLMGIKPQILHITKNWNLYRRNSTALNMQVQTIGAT